MAEVENPPAPATEEKKEEAPAEAPPAESTTEKKEEGAATNGDAAPATPSKRKMPEWFTKMKKGLSPGRLFKKKEKAAAKEVVEEVANGTAKEGNNSAETNGTEENGKNDDIPAADAE